MLSTEDRTVTSTEAWSNFSSVGRRDLVQEDVDSAITKYSESKGKPRYAALCSRYRDTAIQDYLLSQMILPRFANGIGIWEIWFSSTAIVLTGEGRDLIPPRRRNTDFTDEELDRFYSAAVDEEGNELPTWDGPRKRKGQGRGRAKVMHNGIPREDWIREEFEKGRTRRDIADELNVRYQIIFAATKGMKNNVNKE